MPCFFSYDDYEQYLEILYDAIEKHEVMLHAYCLMPNHVHLLLTSAAKAGVPRVLQDIGGRYVRYINYKYHRSGSLWEGRYHSCLVESKNYLIDCYRYIELNPVRKGIVNSPEEYKWSSYVNNVSGSFDFNIVSHDEYLKLGNNKYKRCLAYKELFKSDVNKKY